MQGIRAADVVVYLKVLITQQMSAPGSPGGWDHQTENRGLYFVFL